MLSSTMMQIILCLIFMQLCLIAESTYPEQDRIIALPDQPIVNFQQFSGHIIVDDKTNRSFFYYFVEAEEDPASKPLVLWRAGGPGCGTISSLCFGGSGPFRVNGGGANGTTLIKNPFSFNNLANILYLDSPAGAGFSYAPDGSLDASLNDESVARDDLVFLQKWLACFPLYKNRDLYIGGQSYAGHFVPKLAELIMQSDLKSNLKGLMLAGPLLNSASDFGAVPVYLYAHGMIEEDTYKLLSNKNSSCNYLKYRDEYLLELTTGDTSGKRTPECVTVHKKLNSEFQSYEQDHKFDINNVKSDYCDITSDDVKLEEPLLSRCATILAKTYIEREDVQKSLHARAPHVLCNPNIYINYSRESIAKSMMPTLNLLLRSGVRILVVSGDQDGVVPLISTRKLVDELAEDMKLNTTRQYSAWTREPTYSQVGGFMQIYDDGKLAYATVKGGDHSLTGISTGEAIVLFVYLLNKESEQQLFPN